MTSFADEHRYPPTQPPVSEVGVVNDALLLAVEWGPEARKPIQSRLAARHPDLGADELDKLDCYAQYVRDWAHLVMYDGLNSERASEAVLEGRIRTRCPWISERAFGRLWSQGMYYARWR